MTSNTTTNTNTNTNTTNTTNTTNNNNRWNDDNHGAVIHRQHHHHQQQQRRHQHHHHHQQQQQQQEQEQQEQQQQQQQQQQERQQQQQQPSQPNSGGRSSCCCCCCKGSGTAERSGRSQGTDRRTRGGGGGGGGCDGSDGGCDCRRRCCCCGSGRGFRVAGTRSGRREGGKKDGGRSSRRIVTTPEAAATRTKLRQPTQRRTNPRTLPRVPMLLQKQHSRMARMRMTTMMMMMLPAILLWAAGRAEAFEFGNANSNNNAAQPHGPSVYRYNVCNGLSNQLLYHSASIAIAIEQRKDMVEIPNYFIVNGVQHTDEAVLPNPANSIPFGAAFDASYFLQHLLQQGGPDNDGKKLGGYPPIRAKFVNFDFSKRQIPCAGMQSLHQADADLVRRILQAFRPSQQLQAWIAGITSSLERRDISRGVCVHHRDGQDWYDHCGRWSSIADGIYRGNCLGVPGRSFLESLEDRGLGTSSQQWVYYCGDHDVPRTLREQYPTVSRDDLLNSQTKTAIAAWAIKSMSSSSGNDGAAVIAAGGTGAGAAAAVNGAGGAAAVAAGVGVADVLGAAAVTAAEGNIRDLWALIDFYVCSGFDHFIGNSVSTFSAIQIAMRNRPASPNQRSSDDPLLQQHAYKQRPAYWYNSQSIPLGDIWRAYDVPIVYTYTELSSPSGKHLLQASITSVRNQMPENAIHMLYHGKGDKAFRAWLTERGVLIHNHDPAWRRSIEKMRQNGDPATSHLFLHAGNYLGTWQRIDIPNFVFAEYALQLDADTIVLKPFTLADFGLDITHAIAMSAEMQPDERPSNAGVTLMNIPRMSATYNEFLEFILQHVHSAKFDHPSPSDQGAYLEFYEKEVRFLPRQFNFKPYWKPADINYQDPIIVHFHGAKPHDYLKYMFGDECDKAIEGLCVKAAALPYLCQAIQHFAKVSRSVDQVAYCNASFQRDKGQAIFCNEVLLLLATQPDQCYDFRYLMQQVLSNIPDEFGLPKAKIQQRLRKGLGMMTSISSIFKFVNVGGMFGTSTLSAYAPMVLILWMAAILIGGRFYRRIKHTICGAPGKSKVDDTPTLPAAVQGQHHSHQYTTTSYTTTNLGGVIHERKGRHSSKI